MLDINLNFSEIFKGCFPNRNKKHKEIQIKDFMNSLKNKSKETKINLILEKMINHKNDVGLLYKIENDTFKLITFYGNHNNNQVNYLNGTITPIYENMNLKFC